MQYHVSSRRLGAMFLGVGLGLVLPSARFGVHAFHSVGQPADTVASVDTNDFLQGRLDFTHYDSPVMCLIAASRAEVTARRHWADQQRLDSIGLAPSRATHSAEAVDIARQCRTRFAVSPPPPADLPLLFQLAMYDPTGDSLAQAVLTRLESLIPTPARREALDLDAMRSFLGVHRPPAAHVGTTDGTTETFDVVAAPADLPRARALLAKLAPESDTTTAGLLRGILAHGMWLTMYEQEDTLADTLQLRQEAEAIVTRWDRLSSAAQQEAEQVPYGPRLKVDAALRALMALTFTLPVAQQPAARQGVVARAQHSWANVYKTNTRTLQEIEVDLLYSPQDGKMGLGARYVQNDSNPIFPPLHASFWFSAPGHSAADTVRPVTGKFSLWVNLRENCFDYSLAERPCWTQQAAALRKWTARYGDRLDVTVLVAARGGALWEGKLSPAREAERARWFVQDYNHLPVTVAVQQWPYEVLSAPDDRMIDTNDLVSYEHNGNPWFPLGSQANSLTGLSTGGNIILLDQTGRSLASAYIQNDYYEKEELRQQIRVLDRTLYRLLGPVK